MTSSFSPATHDGSPVAIHTLGGTSDNSPFPQFCQLLRINPDTAEHLCSVGADARRDRLLENVFTRSGFDRDEYPPAVGRGKGRGLTRGVNPTGWMASVQYVPSSENRSHGSVLGAKLRRFCNGTAFRYVFY